MVFIQLNNQLNYTSVRRKKMGVTYIESYIQYAKGSKILLPQNIQDINANSVYRSDEVYQNCSSPAQLSKYKRNRITPCYKTKVAHHNLKKRSFEKAIQRYKSPIVKQEIREKLMEPQTDGLKSTELTSLAAEKIENIIDFAPRPESTNEQTNTTATTVAAGYKVPARKCLWINLLPKMRCPCCCGGGEDRDVAPYSKVYKLAKDSFQSVNLTTASVTSHSALDLDASLMSMLNMNRDKKCTKTPKYYAKIAQCVLRNTYNNTVSILKVVKL